jgi:hypothetical protein
MDSAARSVFGRGSYAAVSRAGLSDTMCEVRETPSGIERSSSVGRRGSLAARPERFRRREGAAVGGFVSSRSANDVEPSALACVLSAAVSRVARRASPHVLAPRPCYGPTSAQVSFRSLLMSASRMDEIDPVVNTTREHRERPRHTGERPRHTARREARRRQQRNARGRGRAGLR